MVLSSREFKWGANMKKLLNNLLRSGKLISSVVLATVVGGLTTGLVLAAIPDSNGALHGCYRNNGGSLRLIDNEAGQTCNGNETAVTWSQTGPTGTPGPVGPAGPSGSPGPRGLSEYSGRLNEVGNIAQQFAALTEITSTGESTRWNKDILSPSETVDVKNFSVQITRAVPFFPNLASQPASPGTGNTRSFSLMIGDTAYALCNVADSATSCSVTDPGITIPANSLIVLRADNTGGLGQGSPHAIFHLEIN